METPAWMLKESIRSSTNTGRGQFLIQVLLDIQSENNWLPKEALERVSEKA
jgi:NADH:ubiquinone oxidoreductase subunit E